MHITLNLNGGKKRPNLIYRHEKVVGNTLVAVDPIKGTKPTTKNEMTDLQSTHKDFLFEIEEVGIKNLVYPVLVDQYQTAGTFSFSTSLTKAEKGINMSRIIESVEKH